MAFALDRTMSLDEISKLVSNPYRATSDTTMGWLLTTYDPDGRLTGTQYFSGATQPAPWNSNTTTTGSTITSYGANPNGGIGTIGEVITFTDEASKTRKSTMDGLGRLAQVVEDPSGLNYTTSYSYDVTDGLTGVNQSGQTRTFTYDSLKRLHLATNPESGTITYTYDSNGNLMTKTDARNVQTTFGTYDALNRPPWKGFSDVTPTVNYCYDGKMFSGGQCAGSVLHSVGRLTWVGNSVSSTSYTAFDGLGRVKNSTQTTANTPYQFSYTYNPGGSLASETYPSGRTITFRPDGAGRVSAVSGSLGSVTANYTSANTAIGYAPHGAIGSMLMGNGLTETTSFNSRLQITTIEADLANSPLWKLENFYCAGQGSGCSQNNGNVMGQRLTAPATAGGSLTTTTTYVYDALNRINSVGESVAGQSGTANNWGWTFSADRYGNLYSTGATGSGDVGTLMPQGLSYFDATTNHLLRSGASPGTAFTTDINDANYPYDKAGNLKYHPDVGRLDYDGEGHVLQVLAAGGGTAQYDYDGEGRRVRKTAGTLTTVYVYDAGGTLVAEYGQGATAESGLRYVTPDHLGSTRLVTNESGAVRQRIDYFPFGQEIPASSAFGNRDQVAGYGDTAGIAHQSTTQEFTGKERDSETGVGLLRR